VEKLKDREVQRMSELIVNLPLFLPPQAQAQARPATVTRAAAATAGATGGDGGGGDGGDGDSSAGPGGSFGDLLNTLLGRLSVILQGSREIQHQKQVRAW